MINTMSIAINLPVNCGYDPHAYLNALVEAQTYQASVGNLVAAYSLGNLISMVSQAHPGILLARPQDFSARRDFFAL